MTRAPAPAQRATRAVVLLPVEPPIEIIMAMRKQMMADMLGPYMGPNTENIYRVIVEMCARASAPKRRTKP